MTPPEPDSDAPLRTSSGDSQNTHERDEEPQKLAMNDTDPARPAVQDDLENTDLAPLQASPPLPADRQLSRLQRPTHPGRPIHAPGASGLLEASELPIPKPPSRPSSRPVQRPTSLLGSAPSSRPLPRPTDPLAPAAPPLPGPPTEASPADPAPPRTPASRPATLRPTTARRDTPTALSGPLSAPPGTSPLSPTRPEVELGAGLERAVDLQASRTTPAGVPAPDLPMPSAPSTRPTRTDPLPGLPDPLDLPLAPGRNTKGTGRAAGPTPGLAPRAPRIAIALTFLAALLLPTTSKPPWLLLDQPAGATGLALAGLLLLPGLTAGPPHLVRWALRLVVAVTLTALTALALADGYTHPPWGDALDPLHGSLILLGLSLLIGATLASSDEKPPRLVAIAGLLLLLAAALIPSDSGVPLLRLVAPLTTESTAADKAAAITTLAFAALTLATGVLRAISPRRRLALGLLVWAAAITPLIVHTALSTAPTAWMDALAPLKTSLVFAAAILSFAAALTPALEPEPSPPGSAQAF